MNTCMGVQKMGTPLHSRVGMTILALVILWNLAWLEAHTCLKEQEDIAISKGEDKFLGLEDLKKMKYTWNVVSEAMRITPPTHGSFRTAITDFTYAGYNISKGSKLLWTPYSTHMNPDWFPEPEKFDPSRFEGKGPAPYTFTPFGGGPRMCPGKEFAKSQILVFLHNVVKRFGWELQFVNEKIVMEPTPVATQGLPLRLKPRQSSIN